MFTLTRTADSFSRLKCSPNFRISSSISSDVLLPRVSDICVKICNDSLLFVDFSNRFDSTWVDGPALLVERLIVIRSFLWGRCWFDCCEKKQGKNHLKFYFKKSFLIQLILVRCGLPLMFVLLYRIFYAFECAAFWVFFFVVRHFQTFGFFSFVMKFLYFVVKRIS